MEAYFLRKGVTLVKMQEIKIEQLILFIKHTLLMKFKG